MLTLISIIVLLGMAVAFFFAWRREYRRAVDAEKRIAEFAPKAREDILLQPTLGMGRSSGEKPSSTAVSSPP